MRLRCFFVLCFLALSVVYTTCFAQTAATQDQLLDAYDALWQQQNRQPSSSEIDASPYTGAQYLEIWESWDAVNTSLAERIYQKGLLAILQGDKEAALALYSRCLEVDPQHTDARMSFNGLNQFDMDEAAREAPQFTTGRAGDEAAAAYRTFTAARVRGDAADAERNYQRAVGLKATFVAGEIQRLRALYNSAVAAFNEEDYRRAKLQFQELSDLPNNVAGYQEVIQPVVSDISRYMSEAQRLQDDVRVKAVFNVTRSSRVVISITGSYYGASSDLGVQINSARVLQAFGLNKGAFVGPDLNVSFRFTDTIWGGAGWSWMLRSPTVKYQSGVFQADALMGGSIHGFSAFVQPGKYVSDQVRLYGQAGVSLFRIDLPAAQLNLISTTTVAVSESPIGFFFGGGADLWNTTIGKVGWGLRLDVKYHIVQTKALAPSNQKLKLNGIRLGAGIIFALGGES